MVRLFKAFWYKLFRDLTFRITLIIGVGIAFLMTGLYVLMEKTGQSTVPFGICTGQSMLTIAMNPAEGFGYSVPINVCTFIVLEFTSGTIRNKIVAGNSKFKIYASLFVSGLVFAISLIAIYAGLCFGLGCAIGGFDPNGMMFGVFANGPITGHFLLKLIVIGLFVYITVTSLAVCIATLIRNIGPCIPIVIVTMMLLGMIPMIIGMMPGMEKMVEISSYINPLHSLVCFDTTPYLIEGEPTGLFYVTISNEALIRSIVCNLAYTGIFFAIGSYFFTKRDVK